jgi:hypothetical protein
MITEHAFNIYTTDHQAPDHDLLLKLNDQYDICILLANVDRSNGFLRVCTQAQNLFVNTPNYLFTHGHLYVAC